VTPQPAAAGDAEDTLAPREAYRLWAPSYGGRETAISFLDDLLVGALTPPAAGLRVLDAGCGTGRRLRTLDDARLRAGVDLTWEMLAAGEGEAESILAAADVRALPFAASSFDLVWCRLVLGHLAQLGGAYAELGRVCAPGGTVLVTDFHPAADEAGHRRTFRDAAGQLHGIEHHRHPVASHLSAATAAGLELAERRDGEVGPELRPFYARAGRLERYEADRGLPVVLALAFRRDALSP
jgi:malonyl-CoA O-methyltransferase